MSPVTHGLLSWLLAESTAPQDDASGRRARLAITLAGLAPDLDGFGAPFEILSNGRLPWFSQYHHQLCHNALAGAVIAILVYWWCGRRWKIALVALVAFHLHLACDVIGARGPDGYAWPIPYLNPFSTWTASVAWSWKLNAWPNHLITLAALAITIALAVRRGRSPLSMMAPKADLAVVTVLRRWFSRTPAKSGT